MHTKQTVRAFAVLRGEREMKRKKADRCLLLREAGLGVWGLMEQISVGRVLR
jgi:hypothetical protein